MKKVLRIIDYNFQRKEQLTAAYDDSNSLRYISKHFDMTVIGRIGIRQPEFYKIVDVEGGEYSVVFLPDKWNSQDVLDFVMKMKPDVIHMHGTSAWPQYHAYANYFSNLPKKPGLIFSPAGGCKGPPDFMNKFDKIIVNHILQIERMRCDHSKVIIRKRSADPNVFHFLERKFEFDFVYVAGFIPFKHMDEMIDDVSSTPYSLVILGDFLRNDEYYQSIKSLIVRRNLSNQIFLHDFISQLEMSEFLAKCRVWVWPNIPPENPATTTNRSVIEALACGKPFLVGEQPFNQTEFLISGFNGYKYSNKAQFAEKASLIMTSLKTYRNNSLKLNDDHFSFQRNFIDFYKDLYDSE